MDVRAGFRRECPVERSDVGVHWVFSVRITLAVLELLRATDVGDTEQVERAGPPLQLSATFPLNPDGSVLASLRVVAGLYWTYGRSRTENLGRSRR
jgi:hypothetical protein